MSDASDTRNIIVCDLGTFARLLTDVGRLGQNLPFPKGRSEVSLHERGRPRLPGRIWRETMSAQEVTASDFAIN